MKYSKPFLAVLAAMSFSTGVVFADTSALEATVNGADGRAAKGAELRIERQDKKATAMVAKTDARGHYSTKALEAGTYRLTAKLPSGAQSTQVVKVQSGKPTAITFEMKQPSAALVAAASPKKPARWVPSSTGTHMGGHYEDEASRGPSQDVDNVSASSIQRPTTQGSAPRQ